MKRSVGVLLGAGIVAASMAMSACSEEGQEYDEICVNQETMIRGEDGDCDNHRSGFAWFYVPYIKNGTTPAHPIGSKVTTSGSFTKPATGTFSRGGFGGYRGSTGGGGG